MDFNINLVWKNISVQITEKKSSFFSTSKVKKTILNRISGVATENSLVAVMGSSGSGKTTLLGAISGRLKDKTGVIKINDNVVTDKTIQNISGYIQQEDVFTETLTVSEHMKFMTALKLNNKTHDERLHVMLNLLLELSLEKSEHTPIRFLSGGERRRLSLATELINNPLILFCDEPTTGLDSFSAMSVIQKLEATSKNGKIVLTTIHQPSSQIFNYFNNLILLANGKLVFQGTKEDALSFFASANLHCPVSYNPADYFIKCLTIIPDHKEESLAQIDQLSNLYENEIRTFSNFQSNNSQKVISNLLNVQSNHSHGFLHEFRWLMWRSIKDSKRNLNRHLIGHLLILITSSMLSTAYSFVTLKGAANVQNIQGAFILIISEIVFNQMYAVIYIFPGEINIFAREKNVYSTLPYYISKFLVMVPHCFINTLIFLSVYFTILEFLSGLGLFLNMFMVLFTASLVATTFGLCLSALFPSVEYIDLFIVPLELLVMTLSGIWIKINTLPHIFGIIKYFSPFFFSLQSISVLHWLNIQHLDNCTDTSKVPCYENGKDVLEEFAFFEEYDVVSYNYLYMFILLFIYWLIGYMGILKKRAIFNSY